MKMLNNLKTFLYDKDFFINIYDDYIHVFNYIDLINFCDKEISIKLEKFTLDIKGDNLIIVNMLQNELLIQGILKGIFINGR